MEIDKEKVDEFTLALLYLSCCHYENRPPLMQPPHPARDKRSWRNIVTLKTSRLFSNRWAARKEHFKARQVPGFLNS